jgi:hypothetical protein
MCHQTKFDAKSSDAWGSDAILYSLWVVNGRNFDNTMGNEK